MMGKNQNPRNTIKHVSPSELSQMS